MKKEINETAYDLLDSQLIFSLSNSFYRATGLNLACTDINGISRVDSFVGAEGDRVNLFCKEMFTLTSLKVNCTREAAAIANKTVSAGVIKPVVYTCHAGLAPVFKNNIHIANLLTGQFRRAGCGEDNLKKTLKFFPAKKRKNIARMYFASKILSKDEVKKTVNMMTFISYFIDEFAEKAMCIKKSAKKCYIRNAKNYIQNYYEDPDLSLEKIAGFVGVSRSYLSDLFNKKTGTSVTRYIANNRIRFARYLLDSTDQSIKSVCFSCGFKTLNHFYRVFKEKTGVTPSEYKIACKKK